MTVLDEEEGLDDLDDDEGRDDALVCFPCELEAPVFDGEPLDNLAGLDGDSSSLSFFVLCERGSSLSEESVSSRGADVVRFLFEAGAKT
jgi:hypothetical protein